MAELVILSSDRDEIARLHRAAQRGDSEAASHFQHLWDDFDNVDLCCFLCDATVERPVYSTITGDPADAKKSVILPLCGGCRALPRLVPHARSMKILRRWSSAAAAAQAHYAVHRPRR